MVKKSIKPEVLVLIATYQGEKWIKEQIISIANQKRVNPYLLISDDGSLDKTIDVVKSTCKELRISFEILTPNKKFLNGTGASKNFYRLIVASKKINNFSHVAFSDQDDIWDKFHLINAINKLKKNNSDGYSSSHIALKSDGTKIKRNKNGHISPLNHFFESAGAGHTYVMTRGSFILMRNFIESNFILVSDIFFHDWLVYAFYRTRKLKWIIDNLYSVIYRQHNSNIIGANLSMKGIKFRLERLRNSWYRNEIIKIYSVLGEKSKTLERIKRFNLIDRLILCFSLWQHRRRIFGKFVITIFPLISK